MRRIVFGTDVPLRWTVTSAGLSFDLEGADVALYVINTRGKFKLRIDDVQGNEIAAVFEGKAQTRLGDHSLLLRINEGKSHMTSAAVQNVFELVEWSADAGGSDTTDVITAPIFIESDISIGSGDSVTIDQELSETSENPVANRVITQALKDKQGTLESGVNIKTINGESILGEGNIEIQSSEEGGLVGEVVSSTEPTASFPQVLYVGQTLTEEQKSVARRNIGVDTYVDNAIANAITNTLNTEV